MKLTKRLLSMLLVLCLVFSLLPTIGLTASAADTSATWTLVTDLTDITAGDSYLILTATYRAYNGTISSGHLQTDRTAAVLSGTTFTSVPAGGVEVTFESTGTDNVFYLKDANGKYITATKASSGGFSISTTSASYGWKFTSAGSNRFNAQYQESGKQAYFRAYSGTSFRSYASTSSGTAIYLAKKASSSATLQSISAGTDNAEFTVGDEFVPATITGTYSDGTTADVTSGCTFTGYDMSAEDIYTVTVTHTASGLTTSYYIMVEAPTTYTVTYHSAGSVYGTATVVEGNAIGADNLPTPTVDGWTFVGWSTTEIPSTQDSKPTLYAGTETVNGNLDLYAVYAKASEGSSGDGSTFKKVTAEKSDWSGTYVIADKNSA